MSLCKLLIHWYLAVSQTYSCWPFIAKLQVQSQISARGICGG